MRCTPPAPLTATGRCARVLFGGCLGGGWLPLPPGVLLWGCFPCLLLLLVLLLVVCCWSRCLLWRCGRSCGAVVRGVRCRPGAVFPGLRGVCRSGAVVGVGVCSGGWAVRGFRAGLLRGRLVCCRRGSWLPWPGGRGRRGRCVLSVLCRPPFLGAFGACVRGGACLSRRGLPREPVSGSLFLRRCPFFGGDRRQMRLPPQKRGYRRRNAATIAICRGGYQPPESDHAGSLSPNHPPPSFPTRGKREHEASGHRCGGDGGRPTGKNGFRPFPPIITGGQAPIFPDLKALWISDGGKIALRRWGVDFARSRPRRNGRKPKKRKEKKP